MHLFPFASFVLIRVLVSSLECCVCWLIQALVNVGRNYNGPKVLLFNYLESKRTGTVVEKDK